MKFFNYNKVLIVAKCIVNQGKEPLTEFEEKGINSSKVYCKFKSKNKRRLNNIRY